jgi:DNA-binding LytR/AlgR family response regulator
MNLEKSILIVEDEPLIADDIAGTLKEKGYGIMGPVDNAEEATSLLSKSKPNLVLLDIQIKGKKDGIQLGNEIRSKYKLPFIYITSFYDRATLDRAKSTEPQAYIVKPFDEKDLLINVDMALYKHRKPPLSSEKFFVKEKNEMIALQAKDIIYAEAFDNYTKVFTEKQHYIISHTLKQVEEKLSANSFVRVHRSYLVNFEKVTSINESNICLGLIKIPLAQSFRQELMERITLL